MSGSKRLSLCFCFFAMSAPLILSGCQSTGGTKLSDNERTRNKLLKETKQFAPDPRGHTTAKSLRPVNTRPTVELLREADVAFQRASDAEARGDKQAAAGEYRHMLTLLEQADLDPSSFYATRKEFAEFLEEEARAGRQHPRVATAPAIQIPAPLPPSVIAQIERIQNDYPNSFQSALDRGQRYMPEIRAKFAKAGLPQELVYVAMIESHYHEKIVSRAGAGGMWQFMPETGRIHGLRQDGYLDQRYDWEVATDAAISYFTKLRDHFNGNWPLAVASYNCGEYGLARAVAAAGGEADFFRLIETEPASNMIKLETKEYYPKFLAYWIVSAHPDRYGFSVNPPQMEPTVDIPVRGSYSLDDLESAMGLSGGVLSQLNPQLVRQVTPPIGENRITVPKESAEKLVAALQTVPQYGQGESIRTHKVRKGETLASVANKYGVTTQELQRSNKLKNSKLHVGQTLRLPYAVPPSAPRGGGAASPADDALVRAAKAEKADRESAPKTTTYTVKKGDTLSRIASANAVSLADLLAANKLTTKSQIKTGQKLKIVTPGKVSREEPIQEAKASAPTKPETAPTIQASVHTVKKGEYLAVIARTYGVSIADIEQWNGLANGATIREGQKLEIRKAGRSGGSVVTAKAAAPQPTKGSVKVTKGDTLGKIAARSGVSLQQLLAWNNLTEKSTIREGQVLDIYSAGGPSVASSEAEHAEEAPVQLASAKSPSSKSAASKAAPKTTAKAAPATVHTVAKGQNPTSIAKQYGVGVGDLFKWNRWTNDHVLKPGDKVVVEKK